MKLKHDFCCAALQNNNAHILHPAARHPRQNQREAARNCNVAAAIASYIWTGLLLVAQVVLFFHC